MIIMEVVKMVVMMMTMTMMMETNEEKEEERPQGELSSSVQNADPVNVFSTTPKVIYLSHDVEEGELVENWMRKTMKGAFNFEKDMEDNAPDGDYVFKLVDEADNFNVVVIEDDSESDHEVLLHYCGQDAYFPTFDELFRTYYEDELKRKVAEKVAEEGIPRTLSREELRENRKKWFKPKPEERKIKRPLKSEGLCYQREFGVQYFKFIKDLKTLPWGGVEQLSKTKNIQQLEWGPEDRQHEQKLWYYIRGQARDNFTEWKPQYPKRTIKIDLVTKEKDITLHVKRPRCMKNIPLKEMEQDFYKDFRGWAYDPKTCRAVIALRDEKFVWRRIYLIDPMWLVNCLKKDRDCFFFNKITYYKADREQA
ncbi:hypothetical protein Hanom_Chr14g01265321 [Helianthus anomalus]